MRDCETGTEEWKREKEWEKLRIRERKKEMRE